MFKKRKKKKYVAIFVLKEQGTFTKLSKKKFNPTNNYVRFKKRTFILDTTYATYSQGLKQFFFIDLESGQTYLEKESFENKKLEKLEKIKTKKVKTKEEIEIEKLYQRKIDPEIVDMFISRKIIAQLTTNLSDTAMRLNIMTLIIGAAIGGLIGYIIAGM